MCTHFISVQWKWSGYTNMYDVPIYNKLDNFQRKTLRKYFINHSEAHKNPNNSKKQQQQMLRQELYPIYHLVLVQWTTLRVCCHFSPFMQYYFCIFVLRFGIQLYRSLCVLVFHSLQIQHIHLFSYMWAKFIVLLWFMQYRVLVIVFSLFVIFSLL